MTTTDKSIKFFKTNKSLLSDHQISDGSIYFVQDTKELYFDYGTTRTAIEDIIILNNDAQRTSVLFTPLNKFYYCLDTDMLYLYNNGVWHNITVDKDFINNSKAIRTGNIHNSKDIYKDIYSYTHSTFDEDKFTKVGNPLISDTGIVTNTTVDNYLKVTPSFVLTNENSWEIITPIYYLDDIENQQNNIFRIGKRSNTNGLMMSINNQSKLILLIQDSVEDWVDIARVTVNLTSDIKSVCAKYVHTSSGVYSIYFKFNEGEWVTGVSGTDTTHLFSTENTNLFIGCNFRGSIDLKTLSIKVDNYPVFSGNTTGIDIIKSDNYTVVGEPTISDGGIVSGFSSANYIDTKIKPDLSVPFKLYCRFNCFGPTSSFGRIIGFNGNTDYNNVLIVNASQDHYQLDFILNSVEHTNTTVNLNYNTLYDLILSYDGSSYSLFYKEITSNSYALLHSFTSEDVLPNVNTIILGYVANYAFNGSIDLNKFRLYSNDNLIYQPCLKIPYTESSTGSKIVNSIYRDRVEDLYNQTGSALYYTIDEENENYTLPMGEIYGMIQSNSPENNLATTEKAGNVKVGEGLTINNGELSTSCIVIRDWSQNQGE